MPSQPRRRKTTGTFLFLWIAAALGACGGGRSLQEGAPFPSQVLWEGGALLFDALEERLQPTVVVKDQTGRTMERVGVRWVSRDPAVVQVEEGGFIVSKGNGSTIVEARAGEAQALIEVSVRQRATRIEVEPESLVLRDIGESARIIALALDRNGHRLEAAVFDWRSSEPTVASVDERGKVVAGEEGETEVWSELRESELSASTRVLVEPKPSALRILLKFPGLVVGAAGEAQVEVLDSAGRRISAVSKEVQLSLARNSGAAQLTGTLAVLPSEGLAVFPDLSVDRPGEGYTLMARLLDLEAESAPFDVFACGFGAVACQDGCVDIQSDPRHCGACGERCGEGMVCEGGSCLCGPGLERCGDRCVDLQEDGDHCGDCDRACGEAEVCNGGSCGCPDSKENCGGACVDPETDPLHCGACGSPCAQGVACISGQCDEPCPPGQALCNQICVDIWSSTQHCGGCGRTCTLPNLCSLGRCMPDPEYPNWPIPADKPTGYQFPFPGAVLDPITRLLWERDASPDPMSHGEAMLRCKNLRLGGFTDWRLPSRIEALSIVDDTGTNPAIDATAFPDAVAAAHWTASSGVATGAGSGFQIDLLDGMTLVRERSEAALVRCVRYDASYPEETALPLRYTVEEDTVTVNRTGLRWQRSTEDLPAASFQDAEAACAALSGRLPRRKELESLVNVRRRSSWPEEFGAGPAGWPFFWTTTPVAGAPSLSRWAVEFKDATSGKVELTDQAHSRCLFEP